MLKYNLPGLDGVPGCLDICRCIVERDGGVENLSSGGLQVQGQAADREGQAGQEEQQERSEILEEDKHQILSSLNERWKQLQLCTDI